MAEEKRPDPKIATDDEFNKFLAFCDSTEHWSSCLDQPKLKVWDQKAKDSAINIVKLWAQFDDVSAVELYDVLHDPEYRAVWDENMIEGFNIEQLDKFNDVGYYSAKAPYPLSNRDFLNQRSWRVREDKEYLIMNHSIFHAKCPEKKGFVRANSILTGYLVRVRPEGGCTLTYLTQTDPKGSIPSMLSNWATKTFAPKIIDKLKNASKNYEHWKKEHNPGKRPWRLFDQN